MTDTITLTGLVATTPRHLVTGEGLPITSFRLASTQRRYDRGAQKWIDADTNWFTVTCFRQLAINAVGSIAKGQRIVVTGRLRIRDWESGDRAGTTVEIDADALGHDLAWGSSVFTRSVSARVASDADPSSEGAAVLEQGADGDAGDESAADSDSESDRPLEAALPF
jgi:single-strand DNA-binding protein